MTSERPASAVMAIAISVAPSRQGERHSGRVEPNAWMVHRV
jgi:hypothetical protein